MNPAVAVAIGDIDIAGRALDDLGGIVEWSCGARNHVAGVFAARVGVNTALSQDHKGPAFERVSDRYGVVTVGEIYDIIADAHAVRRVERAVPPCVEVVAVPVEYDDGRVLPLEHVQPVLRIGGDGADYRECLTVRELREVLR